MTRKKKSARQVSLEKRPRVWKESREFLELLVLIAWKYGEITGGRAVELLGKSREEIAELARIRCGDLCCVCNENCSENWKEPKDE